MNDDRLKALEVREPVKEYDYWLHAINEVVAGKEYRGVFRNKVGKTLPLDYQVKPLPEIRTR